MRKGQQKETRLKFLNSTKSVQVQIAFVLALAGDLLTETTSDSPDAPGKSNIDAVKSCIRDLDIMSKSPEFTTKQRRMKLAEIIAQLSQAIAYTHATSSPRTFSDRDYTVVFTAVQKVVNYTNRNGISLLEQNPVSVVAHSLTTILASAMDEQKMGWYEACLETINNLFSDIQASIGIRQLRPTTSVITYVFEASAKKYVEETEESKSSNIPVASSGEEIDSAEQANEAWRHGKSPV